MSVVLFLDLNATPSEEEFDGGIVPRGGEAVADEESGGDAAQDEEAAQGEEALQDEDAGVQQQRRRLRGCLTDAQRYAAYTTLHARSKNERLEKNFTKEIADFFFGVHIRMIQRIWQTAREQIVLGLEVDVSKKKLVGVVARKLRLISLKWLNFHLIKDAL